jgi:hypothetical protein
MLPHPTSWRSILILFSHLCLGLTSGLLLSGFLPKPCKIQLLCISTLSPGWQHSDSVTLFFYFHKVKSDDCLM